MPLGVAFTGAAFAFFGTLEVSAYTLGLPLGPVAILLHLPLGFVAGTLDLEFLFMTVV